MNHVSLVEYHVLRSNLVTCLLQNVHTGAYSREEMTPEEFEDRFHQKP